MSETYTLSDKEVDTLKINLLPLWGPFVACSITGGIFIAFVLFNTADKFLT